MSKTSKRITNNRRVVVGFAGRLQWAMNAKSLRPVDLKKKLRTQSSHVHHWLSGEVTPNATTLVKMSEVLSVSIDWLLLGSPATVTGEVNAVVLP